MYYVVPRLTRLTFIMAQPLADCSSFMLMRVSTANWAISFIGWCMVVRGGVVYAAIKESSKPTTFKSSGTLMPLDEATCNTWLAMMSEEAKTPSVSGLCVRILSMKAV